MHRRVRVCASIRHITRMAHLAHIRSEAPLDQAPLDHKEWKGLQPASEVQIVECRVALANRKDKMATFKRNVPRTRADLARLH